MGEIEARLETLGIALPPPLKLPPGAELPFPWVNLRGTTAHVSGHGPQEADGSLAGPRGRLGDDVSVDEGAALARKVGLAMLGSLQRELGTLDRVRFWRSAFGMVRCTPEFDRQPAVINGFTELILEVFGPEAGAHARSAVGMAALPFGIAVEIEAVVEIAP